MTILRNAIRTTNLEIRAKLPAARQKSCSEKICNFIKQMDEYRTAKKIALYKSSDGEISLDRIWKSAPLHGKQCYFPMLNHDKTLRFLPATPKTPFVNNKYNIPEPDVTSDKAIDPDEIDIILVPLAAFDEFGTRLGRGVGYYDRTLAHCNHPLLIGVAYEFQRQPWIPPMEWDKPLAIVITETGIHWSKS